MAQPALADLNMAQHMRRRAPPSPFIVSGEPEPLPPAENWGYVEERILWLELPASIAEVARLGVVPTECGAIFILRVRDADNPEDEREIQGYPSAMLDLAWALNNGVGLVRGLSGQAEHDASIIAEARINQGR